MSKRHTEYQSTVYRHLYYMPGHLLRINKLNDLLTINSYLVYWNLFCTVFARIGFKLNIK